MYLSVSYLGNQWSLVNPPLMPAQDQTVHAKQGIHFVLSLFPSDCGRWPHTQRTSLRLVRLTCSFWLHVQCQPFLERCFCFMKLGRRCWQQRTISGLQRPFAEVHSNLKILQLGWGGQLLRNLVIWWADASAFIRCFCVPLSNDPMQKFLNLKRSGLNRFSPISLGNTETPGLQKVHFPIAVKTKCSDPANVWPREDLWAEAEQINVSQWLFGEMTNGDA